MDVAAATCAALEWHQPAFSVPDDIAAAWDAREAGKKAEAEWQARFDAYRAACPELAAELERRMKGDLPADWADIAAAMVKKAVEAGESIATRVASKKALEELVGNLPEMLGGSADLTGSVGTKTSHSVNFDPATCTGNYLAYGVREFGMSAIMNGLALHGGFIPYAGTFMVFSDYARRPASAPSWAPVRSGSSPTTPSVWARTAPPTSPSNRCPVCASCPAWMSGVPATPWRPPLPGSAPWRTPTVPPASSLSRQNLPFVSRDEAQVQAIARGGYVLRDCDGTPSSSSWPPAPKWASPLRPAEALTAEGRKVRVVSMPCCERFDAQDAAYRESVLPPPCVPAWPWKPLPPTTGASMWAWTVPCSA